MHILVVLGVDGRVDRAVGPVLVVGVACGRDVLNVVLAIAFVVVAIGIGIEVFLLVVVIVLVACSVLVVVLSDRGCPGRARAGGPRKQAKRKETIAHDEPQVAIESLRMGDLPIQIKHEAEPPLRLQTQKQRCITIGQLNAAKLGLAQVLSVGRRPPPGPGHVGSPSVHRAVEELAVAALEVDNLHDRLLQLSQRAQTGTNN